jgi:hypothetical protein
MSSMVPQCVLTLLALALISLQVLTGNQVMHDKRRTVRHMATLALQQCFLFSSAGTVSRQASNCGVGHI